MYQKLLRSLPVWLHPYVLFAELGASIFIPYLGVLPAVQLLFLVKRVNAFLNEPEQVNRLEYNDLLKDKENLADVIAEAKAEAVATGRKELEQEKAELKQAQELVRQTWEQNKAHEEEQLKENKEQLLLDREAFLEKKKAANRN